MPLKLEQGHSFGAKNQLKMSSESRSWRRKSEEKNVWVRRVRNTSLWLIVEDQDIPLLPLLLLLPWNQSLWQIQIVGPSGLRILPWPGLGFWSGFGPLPLITYCTRHSGLEPCPSPLLHLLTVPLPLIYPYISQIWHYHLPWRRLEPCH